MDLEPILARIRAEMEKRGWGVADLASAAGHPPAYSNPVSANSSIGRLLKGEIDRPSLQAIGQICAVLDIPFGLSDPPGTVENSQQVAHRDAGTHITSAPGKGGGEVRMFQRVGEQPPVWRPYSILETPGKLDTGEFIIIREGAREGRFTVKDVRGRHVIVPESPPPPRRQ